MTSKLSEETIQHFVRLIADLLDRAAALGKATATLSSQGLTENALETLLDIEPLIYEAKTLLNAASLVNRYARDADGGRHRTN